MLGEWSYFASATLTHVQVCSFWIDYTELERKNCIQRMIEPGYVYVYYM